MTTPDCNTLRTAQDTAGAWPLWMLKLAMRLAQLQRGQAVTLTVLMLDEPVWIVQQVNKVENA